MNSEIKQMLDEIRKAISRCRGPSEREVYEELMAEAEGWRMRLEELDNEEDETE